MKKQFLRLICKKRKKKKLWMVLLKGRYTFGNLSKTSILNICIKPVNFELNWSTELKDNDERKNTLVGRICVLSDRNKRLLASS